MSAAKKSSQETHPWKTTVRTLFQMLIGFLVLLPQIIDASGADDTVPWVGASLAISAAVTRIMAIPGVERWLRRWFPWMAADEDQFFPATE